MALSVGEVTLRPVLACYRYRAYRPLARLCCWPGRLVARGSCSTMRCVPRQDAYAAGEKISDTQVQRRVRDAGQGPPRPPAVLGEVASACFGASVSGRAARVPELVRLLSGKRKGRKVGHPRFRSRKDNRQSIPASTRK